MLARTSQRKKKNSAAYVLVPACGKAGTARVYRNSGAQIITRKLESFFQKQIFTNISMHEYIVPVCFDGKIEATGFIINYKNRCFLITAGHTFPSNEDTQGYYFKFKGVDYDLNSVSKKIEFDESPKDGMDFNDFALFDIELNENSPLHLECVEDETTSKFHCYGFDPDKQVLEKEERTNVNCRSASFYGKIELKNCRMGFGYGVKGYSGGPILKVGTNGIVGMTVLGDDRENISAHSRRQHFIISDFLIKKLEEFINPCP